MKTVGVTMRVDTHEATQERRDSIDQRWYKFLKECDLIPVLLPNEETSLKFVKTGALDGIILTGGNSLHCLGGDALERDSLELKLIQHSIKQNLPLIGVCRGMQILQNYFGCQLIDVPDHVGVRHKISYQSAEREVNSYHKFGVLNSVKDLVVEARSEEGVIEAVSHRVHRIKAIMWHPEREETFSTEDINLFKKCFGT